MSYQPYVDPVGMDPRHYGFVDSVKRAFSQYAKFDGVASVAEYWWFVLFNAILGGVLYFLAIVLAIGAAAGGGDEEAAGVSGGIVLLILGLYGLAVLLPKNTAMYRAACRTMALTSSFRLPMRLQATSYL